MGVTSYSCHKLSFLLGIKLRYQESYGTIKSIWHNIIMIND